MLESGSMFFSPSSSLGKAIYGTLQACFTSNFMHVDIFDACSRHIRPSVRSSPTCSVTCSRNASKFAHEKGKVNDTSRSLRAAVALDLSQHSPLRPVSFAHSLVVNRCSPLLTLIIKPSAYVPWYILGKRGITPPLYIHKGTGTAYDSDQGNADPYTCSVS